MKDDISLAVGDRIRVQAYRMTGCVACIDEDTGEPSTRPTFRKTGTNWATIIRVGVFGHFCAARFDEPIPDINDESRKSDTWSVHPMDIVEIIPAQPVPTGATL